MNSTLGVAGLFDAATILGLEKHHEDLGQTLAIWGVNQGPYLTLPFFEPTHHGIYQNISGNALLNVGKGVGIHAIPIFAAGIPATAPLVVLGLIDKRGRADKALQARDELALDTYVFTRT